MLDFLRLPYRFREIRRRHGQRPFRLLDVGAGNHSALAAKRWFPHCHYAGIDRDRHYHNDEHDFAAMDQFFELDLTRLEFGEIPDASYDVLLFEIIKMFRTGVVPVSADETLELYAFMEAADESKRRGGAEVTLKEVIEKARAEVSARP